MSRGHCGPLTCCDRDCAWANDCQMGGYQCEGCGRWFCADSINADGYCDDCAARREDEENEDEEEE